MRDKLHRMKEVSDIMDQKLNEVISEKDKLDNRMMNEKAKLKDKIKKMIDEIAVKSKSLEDIQLQLDSMKSNSKMQVDKICELQEDLDSAKNSLVEQKEITEAISRKCLIISPRRDRYFTRKAHERQR